MIVIIIGIVAITLACVIALSVILTVIILRKRKKKEQRKGEVAKKFVMAKAPRKMESADINATKFTHGGALVLDAKLHGPVIHAEKEEGGTIQTVQFDPHLNEIVDIGTNVDVIPETNDTTTAATTAAERKTIMKKVIKMGKTRLMGQRRSANATQRQNPGQPVANQKG